MLKTLDEAAEETGLSVREILDMAYEGQITIRAVVRPFDATMHPHHWVENPYPPIVRRCRGGGLILPCSAAQQLDGFGSVEASTFPVEDDGPMADYFWRLSEPQTISIDQVRVDVDEIRQVRQEAGSEEKADPRVTNGVSKATILAADWPLSSSYSKEKLEKNLGDVGRLQWLQPARVGQPGAAGKESHRWDPALLASCLCSRGYIVNKVKLSKMFETQFPEYLSQWEEIAGFMT